MDKNGVIIRDFLVGLSQVSLCTECLHLAQSLESKVIPGAVWWDEKLLWTVNSPRRRFLLVQQKAAEVPASDMVLLCD